MRYRDGDSLVFSEFSCVKVPTPDAYESPLVADELLVLHQRQVGLNAGGVTVPVPLPHLNNMPSVLANVRMESSESRPDS